MELLIRIEGMKRVGDALLLAISRGYVRIVEEILSHPAFEQRDLLVSHPCEQQVLAATGSVYLFIHRHFLSSFYFNVATDILSRVYPLLLHTASKQS